LNQSIANVAGPPTESLRPIIDALPDAIVLVDRSGRIVRVNAFAERLFGYARDSLNGQSVEVLLPERYRRKHTNLRYRYLGAPTQQTIGSDGQLLGCRQDGSEFPVEIMLSPLPPEYGVVVSASVRDITESQRILRQLRESQEYNRGLIESNIDALMTTDPLGLITDVNRMMCEMSGYAREQLIGTPFSRYFTEPARADAAICQVLADDRVADYVLTMRSRDGRETPVSYNATTFRDARNKLRGVFAAARDITAQKQLEEKLRQTQSYTRSLIEASVDALMTIDPSGVIADVNAHTARITGYSREELIGSPFADHFTDPKRAEAGVRLTLAEGAVTHYVLVLRSRDGRESPVSFNASVFKDSTGTVRGIFAAARDITAQTRLEEELRQAQNYTRGLIESSVDPMITVDPALIITDVNEQMVRLTETTKEGLIGSRFDTYFTEPDRAAAGVRKTLSESYVTNYELTLHTPSGREVLVSFNASVFKDTQGKARGIFAVARDVTEQRHLESELREQQNYSRSLIEASVDALMTVNPDGIITDVNEQTVRLTGHSRKQLIGSVFARYFTDPARAHAGVEQTFVAGVVTHYDLVLRSKSGAETVVSFNASVFKDTAGKVAGILASAREITQQKKIERELREQQAYNRGLIESNIDALMTTDPLGLITDVNRQMCTITGYARAQLIGTPFKNYFSDPERAEDGIRQVLAKGRVTNYELTLRARDGKETVVSYNATIFTDEEGQLRGVFAAARDITEQKRLEEQLRQAQNYTRGLIESSVDAMLTVDPDLTITDVNEQMVRLTGYPREQLIGSSFPDYFSEPERARAGVHKTLEEAFVTNYELTLHSRQRNEILVSFNASVFRDTAGSVRGIFAVARDVTEQRRLEEQLREQQNYARGLIESSLDALVTVDPDIVISDVNEQMIKLTGYSREELVGSPFKDYFTEPERAATGVHQALKEGAVTNYELVLRAKSGRRTVVSFNAGTFHDTAGRIAGVLAAARDITAQKLLEEQLREQQVYNRGLIESSVDALMTVNPSGIITDVNEQSVKLTGHSRKQLIGSLFKDYFTEPERAAAGVRQTYEQGSLVNHELVARSKSGRKLPVSFNAAVFRDTTGAVAGIVVAARDIGRQKQIEGELREQQSYTRNLIESNIDALMTTDPLGIITDVNRQMCEITGYSREELIGAPFKNCFTESLRAEAAVRQVLCEDKVTNYELTLRAKDGRETVVSYNATTFKSADGRLRGVFAAARDITEQKRLESQITQRNTALTETTSFLNNVLESSTEYSIIAKDLHGSILTWNTGAQRNYGYSAEEMVGKGNTSWLHTPEDLANGRVQALFDQAFATGKTEDVFERRRKSGERFTAMVSMTLRRDAAGTPIGYLLISKDITEQKRLEEQLRRKNEELEEQYQRVQEANRLKSEFLANMSHELRTPLNAIIGFSELMFDGRVGGLAAEHREFIGDILASARHLLQLINDVLDLAKVEAGKMEFEPETVELGRLIGEVRDVLRPMLAQRRVTLVTEIEPTTERIVTDAGKLKQVLYNYLSNALKFSHEGGEVILRTRAQGADRVRLEVEDHGIGIRPEDLGRLFGEFQQLDASAAKRRQGTGLGLALTRRMVEAQGGEVGVSSEYGKGSVFYAELPREASPRQLRTVAPAPRRPLPAAAAAAPRILVVDGSAGDRSWISSTLTRAGHRVESTLTGAGALALCRERSYDALVLDLLLPDQSGWELLRRLRALPRHARTPVVIAAIQADKGTGAVFRISEYLTQPMDPEELLASLQRAGVTPHAAQPVLVVDGDRAVQMHLGRLLESGGYTALPLGSAGEALDYLRRERPGALMMDLQIGHSDGIHCLSQLRELEFARDLPVLVWTGRKLGRREIERLRHFAQDCTPSGGANGPWLLSGLQQVLGRGSGAAPSLENS